MEVKVEGEKILQIAPAVLVRQAIDSDLEPVMDLIKEFQAESVDDFGLYCDENYARKAILAYRDTAFILEVNGQIRGVLGGVVTNYPLNQDKVFQEFMWYVSRPYRKYGLILLKRVEQWCQEQGINKIIMAHLGDHIGTKLESLYIKLGYKHLECHYIKNV